MTVRTSIRVEPCRLIEIARKDRTVTDDELRSVDSARSVGET